MSTGDRSKPPELKRTHEAPDATTPESAPSSSRRGYSAVRDEWTQAVDRVRYRLTGGAQGTAPAGNLAAERRAIIGGAAARIMRKATGPAGEAQIPKGSGSPLPADVKTKMEPKLGADLSAVRIHTGADSAQAATSFGARAFTVGNDVHFNAGELAPGSKEGDRLLAHELTHVVQVQKSGIHRKADDESSDSKEIGGAETEVSDPDEPAEKEADGVADKVAGELHDEKDERGTSAPKTKPAAPIAAKLDGVGRKVFRSGNGDGNQLKPSLKGGDMLQEALAKLQAAAPASRVELFASFVAQIQQATKGSWSATRQALPDGGTMFVGTMVQNTLVIDKAGSVYRANLIDKEQFPQMNKPNYAKLRKLF